MVILLWEIPETAQQSAAVTSRSRTHRELRTNFADSGTMNKKWLSDEGLHTLKMLAPAPL